MPVHENFIIEFAAVLRRYCQRMASDLDTDRLVKLAASVAQERLWGRLQAAARTQESSIEQLSVSIISNLFIKDSVDSPLAKSLEDVLTSEDVTLFQRFCSVVVRSAEQELFHRWYENDPLSARLWRNLHRVVRDDTRVIAFPADKPEWIALSDTRDLREKTSAIDHVTLAGIIQEQVTKCTGGLGDLVVSVLTHISGYSEHQQAVRIKTLFAALREAKVEIADSRLKAWAVSCEPNPHFHLAVQRAKEAVESDLQPKLERYVTQRKLTAAGAQYFWRALTELLCDCIDGGPAQSYYEYLRPHWPDLTYDYYRQTLRSRFEYLAEQVQNGFLEVIKKQYYE